MWVVSNDNTKSGSKPYGKATWTNMKRREKRQRHISASGMVRDSVMEDMRKGLSRGFTPLYTTVRT